jgi:protein-disulfide isomerase-like protein with CxxC motif
MELEHVRAIVTEQFLAERESQEDKWGEQIHHSDEHWTVILGEEFGEVAREVYEKNTPKLYNELIQCGAVCMAWAEAIQKRNMKKRIEKGDDLI